MDKIYEASLLYDFYGELLTERQRQVYEEVVLSDYSLSEVGADLGISRQGVHDLVQRTQKALAAYEEKLGCVARFVSIREKAEEIRNLTSDPEILKRVEGILGEL